MSATEELKIACYMAWHGAEATFPFSTRQDYEKARAALEKLAVSHSRANELPSSYGGVTDLYSIDVKDRDAFNQIMDAYSARQ